MTDVSTTEAQPASDSDRKARLANAITASVSQGFRIESQSDFNAVMVKGHRPNHILHLILTIITGGIWGIAWILIAIFGGEKRRIIQIDGYGNTLNQKA